MMENAALHEQYTRVITPEPALNEETEDVCALLKECYDLRCEGFQSIYFTVDLVNAQVHESHSALSSGTPACTEVLAPDLCGP